MLQFISLILFVRYVTNMHPCTHTKFFEMNKDRVVRCDCQKYLYISDNSVSDTYEKGVQFEYSNAEKNLFDLCDSNGNYETTVNKEDQNEYTTDDAEVSIIF